MNAVRRFTKTHSPAEFQVEVYDQKRGLEKSELFRIDQIRAAVSNLVQSGRKRILELGCGDGLLLQSFCSNNECHGVDISEQALKEASDKGYVTHLMDLENADLPFPDGYFDIVICAEVLEHIVNTEGLLNEVNRVLQKDATLIVSFPNTSQPISLICILLDITPMYSARVYSPHVRDFTLRLAKRVLEIKGFKVAQCYGTYIYPFTDRVSRLLANRFPRLGEKIILVAQKQESGSSLPRVIWDVRDLVSRRNLAISNCSSSQDISFEDQTKTVALRKL